MQKSQSEENSNAEKIPDVPVASKAEESPLCPANTLRPLRMSGLCAIVTGGSKGIGAGVCIIVYSNY